MADDIHAPHQLDDTGHNASGIARKHHHLKDGGLIRQNALSLANINPSPNLQPGDWEYGAIQLAAIPVFLTGNGHIHAAYQKQSTTVS